MNNMPYQVMLVDDSAVARGLFSRWLEDDDSIQVVAYAANGLQALKELERHELDVVVLDIEMPIMDGMQTLPGILQARPDIKVIMACTLTHHNAEISLKALQTGASDYVIKPPTNKDIHYSVDFRREMVEKIKALAAARRRQKGLADAPEACRDKTEKPYINSTSAETPVTSAGGRTVTGKLYTDQKIELRPQSRATPEILAVGSSTGGPQALVTLFGFLKGHLQVPVVITQHMPATFTSILTDHLSNVFDSTCKVGEDGDELIAGNIYLAPGDRHLLVEKRSGRKIIRISQDPPENFCRPAVDPMMRSLKKVYNDQVLAVILTGMGQDGLKGCLELAEAGSTVLAQDETTSVVWGMPGAVATNGVCSAILPLDKIGAAIIRVLKGERL